ncbi:hypothetical protein OESDEN_10850 [Oesophagostomum dentatum]|uniref:Uncharacterized protein n=1 Tax=Oesophagostomum dentatum TaxID=61180 RepID=A0A0B1SWH9_OESDE|nr:hypothetical protein OESDEN_10850 [Oesophagostomum dentatum]
MRTIGQVEKRKRNTDDDLKSEETMTRILEIAIRKRRRLKRCKRGYSLHDDFLQTRLISTLCSRIKQILDLREKRRKAAEFYLKDLLVS